MNEKYTKHKAVSLATTSVIEAVATPFIPLSDKEVEKRAREIARTYQSLNHIGTRYKSNAEALLVRESVKAWFEIYFNINK